MAHVTSRPEPIVRVPFQVSLAIATTALIILTSAVILAIVLRESNIRAERTAETLFAQSAQSIGAQLTNLFESRGDWVRFAVTQSESLAPVGTDVDGHPASDLLTGMVRTDSIVYSAYIGRQNGTMLQIIGVRGDPAIYNVLKAPDTTDYVERLVAPDRDGRRVDRWTFREGDGTFLGQRSTGDDVYDPRDRPWYKGAYGTDGVFLSSPYVFRSTQALGITISQTLPDNSGVVGLDVTLSGLTGLINERMASPRSRIYLFDGAGTLWVDSREEVPSLTGVTDADFGELGHLASLSAQMSGPQLVRGNRDGVDVLDYIQSWQAPSGQLLYIAITAPVSDFTSDLPVTVRRILLAAGIALLFALPLAYLLAMRMSSALQRLTSDAERMRELRFSGKNSKPSVIKEVDSLGRSFDLMKDALESRTLALSGAQMQMQKLVSLGISLSAERELDMLMESILRGAKDLCHADGGTLYLHAEDDTLQFATMLTDSLGIALGGASGKPINLPPVNMYDPETGEPNHRNVASHAALSGEPVNIPDAYEAEGFDFAGTKKFDQSTGYRSRSFLTAPLKNRQGRVIGVLQLLNATDPDSGEVVPFAAENESFVMALATQAAVALENAILLEEQKKLLDSFIELIASAIDAKSPYTGGHCARVPQIAKWLAEAACESREEPFADYSLTDDDWYEFHIGAWLHDCGKVTTPEYVVDKATKLETIYNRIHEVRTRFEVLIRDAQVAYWRGRAEGGDEAILAAERDRRVDQLRDDFDFVARCNIGGEFMDDEDKERIAEIGARTWQRHLDDRLGLSMDEAQRRAREPAPELPAEERLLSDKPRHIFERENADRPFGENPHGFRMQVPQHLYNHGEIHNLCIDRGTLTSEERFKINDHIIQTIVMLEQLPFPKHLARVPEIAGGHHETMVGTGYPRGLEKNDMSLSARIMAIADIFEALTAADRPYKKAKTLSESLRIMAHMRDDQHIDPDLFELFLRTGIPVRYAQKFLLPEQVDEVDIADYSRMAMTT